MSIDIIYTIKNTIERGMDVVPSWPVVGAGLVMAIVVLGIIHSLMQKTVPSIQIKEPKGMIQGVNCEMCVYY